MVPGAEDRRLRRLVRRIPLPLRVEQQLVEDPDLFQESDSEEERPPQPELEEHAEENIDAKDDQIPDESAEVKSVQVEAAPAVCLEIPQAEAVEEIKGEEDSEAGHSFQVFCQLESQCQELLRRVQERLRAYSSKKVEVFSCKAFQKMTSTLNRYAGKDNLNDVVEDLRLCFEDAQSAGLGDFVCLVFAEKLLVSSSYIAFAYLFRRKELLWKHTNV